MPRHIGFGGGYFADWGEVGMVGRLVRRWFAVAALLAALPGLALAVAVDSAAERYYVRAPRGAFASDTAVSGTYGDHERDLAMRRKREFLAKLTAQEKAFLRDAGAIPFTVDYYYYPISFYNRFDKKWEGIIIDVLEEVSELTGLEFQIVGGLNSEFQDMLDMVLSGEAHFIPSHIKAPSRMDHYIWTENTYLTDSYALLSKREFPGVSISEIPHARIGLIKETGYAHTFARWFPNAVNVKVYETYGGAFYGIDNGEVDLIMAGTLSLVAMTNYYEFSGYKANFIFNEKFDYHFAFNKEQHVLRSIINKAIPMVDSEKITKRWMSGTYDYRALLMREQRPWLIGAISLSLCVIALTAVLFARSRSEGRRLGKLVGEHTSALNALFNSTPDHIFCKDVNSIYTRCNKSMAEYYGTCEENIIGKNDADALGVSLDVAAFFAAMDRKVIEERQIQVVEEYIPSADGRLMLVETIKAPLIQNGEVTGVMGIARDVTRRKAMEEAMISASEAKSRFIANMSHEIRTPMNSIIGFSEFALEGDISPKTREYLNKICDSAELLLEIISDILDISKIEAGKIELERIPFDLDGVIAYCHTAILPKASAKGLSLDCGMDRRLDKMLLGDSVRLRQALLNMLTNAVKFTEVGAVELSVTVREVGRESVTLLFEVRDTGIGMTPEQIARVFEPFIQADNSITRRYGGTGLGLAITKSIIEMMGGELRVDSGPGKGSEFSFELKFDVADDKSGGGERAAPRGGGAFEKQALDGEVLVCEDNEMNQQVLCEHLERVGLNMTVVENGMEAVDAVAKRRSEGHKPFDLILMDIHMPVMDGLEAAARIARLGVNTPVVAITASIMAHNLEFYRSKGMADVLGKPFKTQDLRGCLAKYCRAPENRPATETDENNVLDDIQITRDGKAERSMDVQSGRNTVLVVDDEKANIITLTLMLSRDYTIYAAKNGPDALELARERKPDLILLDVIMPDMGGYEIIEKLKGSDATKDIPVIFVTGLGSTENEERGMALGAVDYIAKPFTAEAVKTKVREHIRAKAG